MSYVFKLCAFPFSWQMAYLSIYDLSAAMPRFPFRDHVIKMDVIGRWFNVFVFVDFEKRSKEVRDFVAWFVAALEGIDAVTIL